MSRTAIVTGAARGIGAAVADRLRAEGCTVAGWDIRGDPPVDVTDAAAMARAAAALPPVDVLVLCAGVLGPVAPAWEVAPEDFARVVAVNLLGAQATLRAVVPRMLAVPAERRAGRIVAIASVQAKEGTALAGAYAASKAGLIALVKSVGKELAREGILANAVTPTVIETDMLAEITPERAADLRSRIPMGRFGQVSEVAEMVAWLASPACSFSTGAVFDLSGGRATY
ncbi:SDR family oxidoreductase [Roseomonas sp. OT10]|uniref:SDR family NAD(P)-dependent oxidoreductase n=1 Tax=Roseomonas cutis TaxID=2897332 RepID=UPI001E56DBEF|nr:SDR family NAD(P)-dependent oxidoreductase [Roseomonas sp. OT10]UFN49446.1 SDR family oxidoreductase [Roseomonas sp. OT10]